MLSTHGVSLMSTCTAFTLIGILAKFEFCFLSTLCRLTCVKFSRRADVAFAAFGPYITFAVAMTLPAR